jgi:hypothetical protein
LTTHRLAANAALTIGRIAQFERRLRCVIGLIMRRFSTILVLALASSPAHAGPDPTTAWPEPKLGEDERLAGQTTKPGGGGLIDQPAQRWISPSGHAVVIAPVWTKDRVVIRAYWNDPKARMQDVVTIPGPVVSTGNPFYKDHADGQLALSVTGNIGGPDKGFAYRLRFDPKSGFKIVKKAAYVYGYNNNQSPEWLNGKFEISNPSRAHSLGSSLRLQENVQRDMSRPLTVITRAPSGDAPPVEETLPTSDLVKRWDAAGQRPAVGFGAKCNDEDNCCTYDTKKLGAWLHVEKICFIDNKPGKLFLVAPK